MCMCIVTIVVGVGGESTVVVQVSQSVSKVKSVKCMCMCIVTIVVGVGGESTVVV